MAWTDLIEEKDLPPGDYQLIHEAIGLEGTVKLALTLNKAAFYLRDPHKLFYPVKKRYVLKRYKEAGPDQPFNHKRIAQELDLSERAIYDIINETREKAAQGNLFQDED